MKYRKLRIAWSACCGTAVALLLILWVRSYFVYYIAQGGNNLGFFRFDSEQGNGSLMVATPQNRSIPLTLVALDYDTTNYTPTSALGFVYRTGPDFVRIGAPYWFYVIATSLFAAAPWLRRVPYRFSLRTLLIATTLVAVVLGLIVYAVRG